MKVETVIKVLNRYAKSLNIMACDCKTEDEKIDKEHYKFDKQVFEEAIRLIKRNSRRYAKRQYTFFNNQFKINWFMTNFDNFDETIREVCNYIDEKETIS